MRDVKQPDPALVYLLGKKIVSTCSGPVLVPRVAHRLCLGDIWRLLGVGLGNVTRDQAVMDGGGRGMLQQCLQQWAVKDGCHQERERSRQGTAHGFQRQKPLSGAKCSEMERLLVAKTPTGSRGKETGQDHGC